MNSLRALALVLLLAITCSAQTAEKLSGVGNVHHPVSTKSAEAQSYFDQGLALVYGFNHDEAAKAFTRAAELDPKLAMAQWGVALVYGANYNMPSMPEREKIANEAMQRALALAPNATPEEQAYIAALSKRYSPDPHADLKKLAEDYADAMRQLSHRYPDDLDAATLFAESMMDLRPWALWNADGTPAPGTEEILHTLESVLKRDPDHLGANHYYIHAVEGSNDPERALPSAERLAALAPAAGHLVHMPSHIYSRVGSFDDATRANIAAEKADEAYIQETHSGPDVYTMMYYSHNIHFESYAASMEGNYAESIAAAQKLAKHVEPAVKQMPMLEAFLIVPVMVLDRFHRADDVLRLPPPDASLAYETAIWHYARGMAFAQKGDSTNAAKEQSALAAAEQKMPEDKAGEPPTHAVTSIASDVLQGEIAKSKKDYATAEARLKAAVALQDGLRYTEPPDWFRPVREQLGSLYLAAGRAADAEKVFREDLSRNPRNGRSLFGLMTALRQEGNSVGAAEVEAQYKDAWQKADVKLDADSL